MQAQALAGQIAQGFIGGVLQDRNDHFVFHVGDADAHGLQALGGDAQAVPDAVDIARIQLHLLGVPIDAQAFQLYAQLIAHGLGHVDIKARNFARDGIQIPHRGEAGVQAQHKLAALLQIGQRRILRQAMVRRDTYQHHTDQQQRKQLFHRNALLSEDFLFSRPMKAPC